MSYDDAMTNPPVDHSQVVWFCVYKVSMVPLTECARNCTECQAMFDLIITFKTTLSEQF